MLANLDYDRSYARSSVIVQATGCSHQPFKNSCYLMAQDPSSERWKLRHSFQPVGWLNSTTRSHPASWQLQSSHSTNWRMPPSLPYAEGYIEDISIEIW